MEENKLIMMMGLPQSGKSTLARTIGAPIVCPDTIRLALHGQAFVASAEPFVWAIAKVMVRALFLAGHDRVVLDATNGTKKRRDEWKSSDWKREFLYVDTPAETCRIRAITNNQPALVHVIDRMKDAWEPLSEDEK
jgi:predicted kinase